MTKIDGVPDSSTAIGGMAYFAGTGPKGLTCANCRFLGYQRRTATGSRTYAWRGCAKFKEFSGKHGPEIDKKNSACKYWEKK